MSRFWLSQKWHRFTQKIKNTPGKRAGIFGFIWSALVGTGVGFSAGIGTLWMMTAPVAEAGMGLAVLAIGLGGWLAIAGFSALSLVISAAVTWYVFNEYTKTSKRLRKQREEIKTECRQSKEKLQEALLDYVIQALHYYAVTYEDAKNQPQELKLPSLEGLQSKKYPTELLSELIYRIFTTEKEKKDGSILLKKIIKGKSLADLKAEKCCEEELEFIAQELDSIAQEADPLSPTKPGIWPVICAAAISFVGTFGAVLGTEWSVAAVFIGVGATIAASPTPLGWTLFAFAFVLSLTIGGLFAYYTYKNKKNEAIIQDYKRENNDLSDDCTLIEKQRQDMQKEIGKQDRRIIKELRRQLNQPSFNQEKKSPQVKWVAQFGALSEKRKHSSEEGSEDQDEEKEDETAPLLPAEASCIPHKIN